MKEFLNLLFSGVAPVVFLVFVIYAYIGLGINLLVDILSRDKFSINSPFKFSWKYWWQDNNKRLIISLLLIPVIVVLWKMMIGGDLNNYTAFMIGWTGDAIANLLKKRGVIPNADAK